jgi:hypothetical protein
MAPPRFAARSRARVPVLPTPFGDTSVLDFGAVPRDHVSTISLYMHA